MNSKTIPLVASITLIVSILLSSCMSQDDIPQGTGEGYGSGLNTTPTSYFASELLSTTTTTYVSTTTSRIIETTTTTKKNTPTASKSVILKTTTASKNGSNEIPIIEEKERIEFNVTKMTFFSPLTKPHGSSNTENIRATKAAISQLKQSLSTYQKIDNDLKENLALATKHLEESKILFQESKTNAEKAKQNGNGGAYLAYQNSINIRKENVKYYEDIIINLKATLNGCEQQINSIQGNIETLEEYLQKLEVQQKWNDRQSIIYF